MSSDGDVGRSETGHPQGWRRTRHAGERQLLRLRAPFMDRLKLSTAGRQPLRAIDIGRVADTVSKAWRSWPAGTEAGRPALSAERSETGHPQDGSEPAPR